MTPAEISLRGAPPATYDQAVSVVRTSRARPQLSALGVDEYEPIELIGKAETYEAAYAQLEAQLPEGWVLLGIDRYLEA